MEGEEKPLVSSRASLVEGPRSSGLTGSLVLAVMSCVIGSSFQYGYSTGVMNEPQTVIEQFLNATSLQRTGYPMSQQTSTIIWALIVSIYAVGGMIGGISTGFLADKFGRKGTMLLNNIIILLACGLMGFSKMAASYEMLIVGRFIVGISCGISTGVAPVYLSEIAPVSLRGLAGTINQLAITIAILMSEILGLRQVLGTAAGWPVLLGLQVAPAVVQLAMLPMCPESPRYLLLCKGRQDQAEKVLLWLRGGVEVENDIQEMLQEQQAEKNVPKVSILGLFSEASLRWPLIISIVMHLSQQLSGINAVIFYSTSIFENSGLDHEKAQLGTLGTGVVNIVMTFVAAVLMDRAGRRTLHLVGLGGMLVFSILLTITFVTQASLPFMAYVGVAATILFVVFFATGPGSIPWFIVAELFAQGPRTSAMSVAVLVNWVANFAVGLGFPAMQQHLKSYSFIPFSILLAIFWVFTYFKVPETKNRTIEDITAQFRAESPKISLGSADTYQTGEPEYDISGTDQ